MTDPDPIQLQQLKLAKLPLVLLVQDLLQSDQGRAALANHDFLPLSSPVPSKLKSRINVEEIIMVLKLICEGASIACPVIDSLP